MGKRILITSTDLMMIQFLAQHIENFAEHGYEIEIACSNVGGYMDEIKKSLKNSVKAVYTVSLVRSPFSFLNIKGYRELRKIILDGDYDIIWTNEPVMGAVTRLAARKSRKDGTRIVYMVHGFHFYSGAPIINWVLFYPIERMLSTVTDYIITLNSEDFKRAKRFPVKHVYYIHGIGAIPEEAFLILSVGELNANKNQKIIIDALSLLQDKDIYYVLCGSGKNLKTLQAQSRKCQLQDNIRFVDYRRDIINFYDQADVFVLPSYREGMPIALLEAMYCGVTPVTSDIRGVKDVMKDGITGVICSPGDSKAFAEAIKTLKEDKRLRKGYGENSRKAVKPYMLSLIKKKILDIFESFEGESE